MYNDFRGTSRDAWKYTYTGQELRPYAEALLKKYSGAEDSARNDMSMLMADRGISTQDRSVTDAKESIEKNGSLREQCQVYVHEFRRSPTREYHLSLGDVVFFGIVKA